MGHLDIAIAGCGTAGLAAATLLHNLGHRVTLYERFERPRPLGSGLMIQPTGLAVLDKLGLAAATLARGSRIDRLLGINERGKVVLDARYSELGADVAFGIGIHRASLFDLLHATVATQGIELQTQREIIGSILASGRRRLVFRDGSLSPPHDLIVDALGLQSPLATAAGKALDYGALWITLKWPEDGTFDDRLLEQRYRTARQMAGVLPIGRRGRSGSAAELAFFWSIRVQDLPAWRAAGLEAWKRQVLDLWPDCDCLLAEISDPAQLTFARYAHRTAPHPIGDRIVHIGDAWHSASPQLGQGANMALLDA